MTDISLIHRFHNLVGFSLEEIKNNFEDYLSLMQKEYEYDREELMEEIQRMYNGYSWDAKQRLYNPYSLVNAFYHLKLNNYWFQSGTPTFLIKLIRKRQIFIPDLEKFKADAIIQDSENLNDIDLISLLFQTGYLTVDSIRKVGRKRRKEVYKLKYPNEEVRESMITHLFANNVGLYNREIVPLHAEMFDALEAQDMKTFLNILKSTFSKIPAKLHLKAEAYYHSLFYMLLYLLGAEIKLEEQAIGRVDAILETDDLVYIIEFKFSKEGKMENILAKALKQIQEKKYFEAYLSDKRKVLLLGVGFLGKEEIDLKLENLPS